MCDDLFWTIFSAIFSAIGALATTAAVIVALWQTKYSNRKELKLTLSENAIVTDSLLQINKAFIALHIVNTGIRNVTIVNWGFSCHEKESHVLIRSRALMMHQPLNHDLPYELACDKKLDLYFERDDFIKYVKECFEKKKLKEHRRICFFAVDSAGTVFRVRTAHTVKKLLAIQDIR